MSRKRPTIAVYRRLAGEKMLKKAPHNRVDVDPKYSDAWNGYEFRVGSKLSHYIVRVTDEEANNAANQ